MSRDIDHTSRTIADASGFPLQIRIKDVVSTNPKWKVFLEEHPWVNADASANGFIDLVAQSSGRSAELIVIECKRVKDPAQWVFLIPSRSPQPQKAGHSWASAYSTSREWVQFDWKRVDILPASLQSSLCAMPGQEQGRNILLERTTSHLISSIEALAVQERTLFDARIGRANLSGLETRFYTPVLVTNALLRTAAFDPQNVSLRHGTLPDDAKFETVPFIRFRKAMGSIDLSTYDSILDAASASEKTIFVVNSEHFADFLDHWEYDVFQG